MFGLQTDIIALAVDPLKDITAVRRVMRGGIVYKNAARRDSELPSDILVCRGPREP